MATSSPQAVEGDRVVAEEFSELSLRYSRNRPLERLHPLGVLRRPQDDRPVAAEDDAVGAEALNDVVDVGLQVLLLSADPMLSASIPTMPLYPSQQRC